jgi:hypothetical protein
VAGRYGNGTAARKADIACVAPSWRSRSVAKCLPPTSALAISAGETFSSTCPEGQIPGHVDEKWSSLMRTYIQRCRISLIFSSGTALTCASELVLIDSSRGSSHRFFIFPRWRLPDGHGARWAWRSGKPAGQVDC